MNVPDMILYNGKITTLDPSQPEVSAIAITDGLITAVGGDELLNSATEKTKKIDLKRKRTIPGLNDSHIHVIRGGLHYNMELRWKVCLQLPLLSKCSKSRQGVLLLLSE